MSDAANIEIVQGVKYSCLVTVADSTGAAVNLTGSTFTGGEIRLARFDDDPTANELATFTVTQTDLANGQITLSLSAATTKALDFETAVWDLVITYPSGLGDRLHGSATLVRRVSELP